MADLISREAFKRKLYEADCVDKYGFVNCGVTRINILLEQSAVDAVEVVRCKDCKHMAVVGVGYRWCKAWERIQTMGDDGYCCFGERRGENEEI